ncbi:MAG: phage portal protein [Ruminococcus sp.]|nr:phage portal protein [Ruminococcus sp.]
MKSKLNGRRRIYSSYTEVTDENVTDIIKQAYAKHLDNREEIEYLHRYLKGDQPILRRIKEVRPEICNKIVENHAMEINNFKVGFIFGEPVQYVKRGDCQLDETKAELPSDDGIAGLNEYMQEDDKASKDRELAEWINQCGVGYKMPLPTEKGADIPFETYILDPRTTFVVYTNDYRKKPLIGCTYSICKDYSRKNKFYSVFDVYSDKYCWKITNKDGWQIIRKSINGIGAIPIIEYNNNPERIGSFECVITICDAINLIASNNLDGIEQIIQAFTWFDNVDIDQESFKALKDMGAIKTKSPVGQQANIKTVETKLDTTQTQTAKDDLYDRMLTIACVPDRRASAGGNTGQALIIGEGWIMAESSAKAFELMFAKPEKEYLRVVLKCCRDTVNCNPEVKNIAIHDIEVKFTRNKTDNLLTKTQGLMNMLQAGIHPRIAISHCGLFSDPEQVYQDSKPYLTGNSEKDALSLAEKADDTVISNPVTDEMLKALNALTSGGGNNDEV